VTDDQKIEEMIRQKYQAPIALEFFGNGSSRSFTGVAEVNMHASPVAKVSRMVTDERFDPR